MAREEVRVSQDRIGVLIGKAGATKKSLEEKTGSRISVDSKEGIVVVEGEDAEGVISAVEVVRAIGRGFSPEQIEDMTGTAISVYGKTVAIIGGVERVKTARTAVEMLLSGVPHETVFSFLDRKKREAKQDLLGTYY
jgi:ribosomal RNA assembly protein